MRTAGHTASGQAQVWYEQNEPNFSRVGSFPETFEIILGVGDYLVTKLKIFGILATEKALMQTSGQIIKAVGENAMWFVCSLHAFGDVVWGAL